MGARDHRPALNALRALSASIVAVYHLRYFSNLPILEILPWLRFGNLGVDFFFILSGLIICHVYPPEFLTSRGGYRTFLLLRISRLLPVHLVIMAALLLLTVAAGGRPSGEDMFDWLTLTLMVRQFLMPDEFVWNTAAWSVSAELFAYAAIFPAIALTTKRLNGPVAGAVLILLGWLDYVALVQHYGIVHHGAGPGPLLRVTAGFLIGAGLYRLLANARPSRAGDALLVAGVVSVFCAAEIVQSQLSVIAGLVPIIAGAYLGRGPIAHALGRPLPHYLGEISFSLYLVHIPVLLVGGHIADGLAMERGLAFCLIALGVAVALAIILYEHVEVPARRVLRSRLGLGAPHDACAASVSVSLPDRSRRGPIGEPLA